MKKFFTYVTMLLFMGAPVSMTSCDDDDVNTILEIVDALLSTNDLTGTAWITADNTKAIEFTSTSQGAFYDGSSEGESFTYTVDTNTNELKLAFSNRSVTFTIVSFTKNSSLVIRNSSYGTLTFQPFTGE